MKTIENNTIIEPSKKLPVVTKVNVLVAGGNPSVIIAAQATSGDGVKVTLVENKSLLGDNLTVGPANLRFSKSERSTDYKRCISRGIQIIVGV